MNEFGNKARQIEPKFEVLVARRIWNVTENRSIIEIVLDEGSAQAIDRQAPILELELELKDGNPQDLFALARKIEAAVPIRFGVLSTAERGFRLLEAARVVVKSEPIELGKIPPPISPFRTSCPPASDSFV